MATPLAVVFFDIDGLKRVNDTLGHRRGDELLAAAGAALIASLRSYDVVVRYGGDEFVCALPGATVDTASDGIQRAQCLFAELEPGAALSAGQAQLQPGDTLDDIVHRADMDLYRRRAGAKAFVGTAGRWLAADTRGDVEDAGPPSLRCGACQDQIALREFAPVPADRMTWSAACPGCGSVTTIQLVEAANLRTVPSRAGDTAHLT